ncbi:MAG: hypothetical protein KKC20_15890 [Proteobacteria bacterium]|nr:hypothetical protein [Pseudomonadota bacterium]
MEEIISAVADDAEAFDSFDELAPNLLDLVRKAFTAFYFKAGKASEFPMGMTLDEFRIDYLKNGPGSEAERINVTNVNIFCFGYSEKKQCMGWLLAHTLFEGGFELVEKYGPFLWFLNIEPILEYSKRLGHAPQTDKEIAEGLRLVYKSELDPNYPLTIGGGHIQMTTIYPDKKITVENVGLLVPGQEIKRVKKKRPKRKKQNH